MSGRDGWRVVYGLRWNMIYLSSKLYGPPGVCGGEEVLEVHFVDPTLDFLPDKSSDCLCHLFQQRGSVGQEADEECISLHALDHFTSTSSTLECGLDVLSTIRSRFFLD